MMMMAEDDLSEANKELGSPRKKVRARHEIEVAVKIVLDDSRSWNGSSRYVGFSKKKRLIRECDSCKRNYLGESHLALWGSTHQRVRTT